MLRGMYDRTKQVPYEKLEWVPDLPVFFISPDDIDPSLPHSTDIETHWHRSIEMLYTGESSTALVVNGRDVPLGPGSLYVINSRDVHGFPEVSTSFTGLSVQVEYQFAKDVLPDLDDCTFVVDENNRDSVIPLVLAAYRFYRENRLANHDVIVSLATAILQAMGTHCAQRHARVEAPGARDNHVLQSILTAIDYRYTEDLSLEELARRLNISYSYLARLVHDNLGMSAKQYLTNKRYAQGHFLLVTTDKTVADIAYESGFPNTNAFIREFKKRDGITPAAYRRRLLETV